MTKTTKSLTPDDLRQFIGTEKWHRHPALGQMKVYIFGKPYPPTFHALVNS
jgi:hypothetical protein